MVIGKTSFYSYNHISWIHICSIIIKDRRVVIGQKKLLFIYWYLLICDHLSLSNTKISNMYDLRIHWTCHSMNPWKLQSLLHIKQFFYSWSQVHVHFVLDDFLKWVAMSFNNLTMSITLDLYLYIIFTWALKWSLILSAQPNLFKHLSVFLVSNTLSLSSKI